MKECCKCHIKKPLDEFGKDGSNKDGHRYKCKDCFNAHAREFAKNNPKIIKARNFSNKTKRKEYYDSEKGIESSRRSHLKRMFGITLEDYNEMSKKQNDKCAICNKKEIYNRNKVLCIDHNHETDKIRGLLCNTCNRALGLFKDDKENMKNAIKYLENYE